MLLTINDKAKEDIEYLKQFAPDVLTEFCKISLEFIRKGANPKLYSGAAKKLGVATTIVQHSVEGLSFLLLESSRSLVSEMEFLDSLLLLQFPKDIAEALKELYIKHRREIRVMLAELSFSLPHYEDVNWRLDVQLASRTLRNQINPILTVKLTTLHPEEKVQYFQIDYLNLRQLVSELEVALKEVRSGHCRRIVRNVR